MERIKPPSELDIDSLNLAEEWNEWKEAWELCRVSSGLHDKNDAVQIATIQSVLGNKARRVLKTLPGISGDITERTVAGILTALETYCVPRKNTIYEQYRFRTTVQEGRSIDVFVTDLRRRAAYCDFGAIKESLIRDQIVVGISNPKLRERLLRETDLTLEKAVKLCRITEQSKEQSKIFSSPPTEEGSIDTVKKIQLPVDTKKSKQEDSKKILKCKFCAMSHNRGNCPAYGATCLKCNGRNYYARCCLKPKNDTEERRVRHVQIELSEDKEPMEGLYIKEIQGSTRRNIQSDLLVAQKMVEKHFGDISGALPTFHDIIIGGKDEQEHDLILRKVLTRARECHIKFNRDKIQFHVSQVKYMGEVVSESGFSPDPEKISAIHNMPTPSCKQDLQRLLGMINYLAKYIPNMSELTAPLRSLLKSDVPWAWLPEHDTALTKLKSVIE